MGLAELVVLFLHLPSPHPHPQSCHQLWPWEINHRIHWNFSLRAARAEPVKTENLLVERCFHNSHTWASTISTSPELTDKWRRWTALHWPQILTAKPPPSAKPTFLRAWHLSEAWYLDTFSCWFGACLYIYDFQTYWQLCRLSKALVFALFC